MQPCHGHHNLHQITSFLRITDDLSCHNDYWRKKESLGNKLEKCILFSITFFNIFLQLLSRILLGVGDQVFLLFANNKAIHSTIEPEVSVVCCNVDCLIVAFTPFDSHLHQHWSGGSIFFVSIRYLSSASLFLDREYKCVYFLFGYHLFCLNSYEKV